VLRVTVLPSAPFLLIELLVLIALLACGNMGYHSGMILTAEDGAIRDLLTLGAGPAGVDESKLKAGLTVLPKGAQLVSCDLTCGLLVWCVCV